MTAWIVLLAIGLVMALTCWALAREIRCDGYGHRPPPRSHEDEDEPRDVQLARLTH